MVAFNLLFIFVGRKWLTDEEIYKLLLESVASESEIQLWLSEDKYTDENGEILPIQEIDNE